MKKPISLLIVLTVVLTVNAQELPNVVILATGGTIAGAAPTKIQEYYEMY